MLLSIFLQWFCQMLFGQYGVKFFPNILEILIFCDIKKKFDPTLPKKHLAKPFEKYA